MESPNGTSSESLSKPPVVDGQSASNREMPTDANELDHRYPPNGDATEKGGNNNGGGNQPAGESVPDPLMELLFGDGAALPFDIMAAKTGKAYWVPSEKGRKLLADEAANCSKFVGLKVDRETSPLMRLGLAYVAVGIKPALMVMYEKINALERRLDDKKPDEPKPQ